MKPIFLFLFLLSSCEQNRKINFDLKEMSDLKERCERAEKNLENPVTRPKPGAKYYRNPQEMENFLKTIAQNFPSLTKLEEIGKSWQKKSIWAMEISSQFSDVRSPRFKPSVYFGCGIHPREVMTPEVCADLIEHLLAQYESDQETKKWLDHTSIWVVPYINVDGGNYVFSGHVDWRKNAQISPGQALQGVDLNRNFDYEFGLCKGSSGDPNNETYRGSAPFSEPETKALKTLIDKIHPSMSISYHSHSEYVIYPLGCIKDRSPRQETLRNIATEIAQALPRDCHSEHYPAREGWRLLYPVDGEEISWLHDKYQTLSLLVEMNSVKLGFHPIYDDWRDETVKKMRISWKTILRRLWNYNVSGVVTIEDGKSLPNVTVKSKSSSQSELDYKLMVNKQGQFRVVLEPGLYEFWIGSEGHNPIVVDVKVDLEAQWFTANLTSKDSLIPSTSTAVSSFIEK